jgi:hypothetical protein
MMELQELKAQWLKEPLFRKEYDELEIAFIEAGQSIVERSISMPIPAKTSNKRLQQEHVAAE